MSDSVTINAQLPTFSSVKLGKAEKAALYENVLGTILAEVGREGDIVMKMATICALLKSSFPYYFWAGFYRVNPENSTELIIGPYQGTYACTHITMSRGVCGRCARIENTVIVPDVHDCPYHIACDSKSRSEIVVPAFDASGKLIAVFDVDSEFLEAFDDVDQRGLERIMRDVFAGGRAPVRV